MKSVGSSTREAVVGLKTEWLLALTGTPVQNNLRELFGLLNLLDPATHGDEAEFLARFGDDRATAAPGAGATAPRVAALRAALRPLLLRRMKEDVEALPELEEVVVWCSQARACVCVCACARFLPPAALCAAFLLCALLSSSPLPAPRSEPSLSHLPPSPFFSHAQTPAQKKYYRAIFEGEIGALLGPAAKNLPGLRNLAMELRKVCAHPFLCEGLEADAAARRAAALAGAGGAEGAEGGSVGALAAATSAATSELDALVEASGKMVLLHKLLGKLRAEGRKVLIFSQFVIMLDVLEEYLRLAGHAFERIDGNTAMRDRQAAIDRFSWPGAPPDEQFVFLLSTKAGGQGITLTAADTCVIYDSDWNPQVRTWARFLFAARTALRCAADSDCCLLESLASILRSLTYFSPPHLCPTPPPLPLRTTSRRWRDATASGRTRT
jgi:SNF2 family DNA or RNA helicase